MLPPELRGCCNDNDVMIDFSKMEVPQLAVRWSDANLWISVTTIIFNPLFWNVVARSEYHTKWLSNIFRSPKVACTILAFVILFLGLFRDWRFNKAINSQPHWEFLYDNWALWSGYGCILIGCVLVFTSFTALGFYGTFLGDYFGILMDEKVTDFPFNVIENPMYWGSALNFFGTALVKASQAGILLSILVCICYEVAILYENPFTAKIYQDQAKKTE